MAGWTYLQETELHWTGLSQTKLKSKDLHKTEPIWTDFTSLNCPELISTICSSLLRSTLDWTTLNWSTLDCTDALSYTFLTMCLCHHLPSLSPAPAYCWQGNGWGKITSKSGQERQQRQHPKSKHRQERPHLNPNKTDHIQIEIKESTFKTRQKRQFSHPDQRDPIQIHYRVYKTTSKSITGHKRPHPNPDKSDLNQFQTREATLKSKQ